MMSDPSATVSTLVWLATAAGFVALIWFVTAVFAFWRIGKQSTRIHALENLTALAGKALDLSPARPIWIWPDGQCEANEASLVLLRASGTIKTTEDLANALGQWQFPNLAGPYWADWHSAFQDADGQGKITLKRTKESETDSGIYALTALSVRYDRLPGLDPTMPDTVLWVRADQKLAGPHDSALDGVAEPAPGSLWASFFQSPIPASILDNSGLILYVNNAYLDAVGAEDIHTVVEDQIHISETPPKALVTKVKRSLEEVAMPYMGLIRGQRTKLLCTAGMLADNSILIQYLDVSKQSELEFENKRLVSTQAELLNRLRTPIAIFSGDRTLQFFNESFCRISKLESDWLTGSIDHGDLLDAMRANRRVPEQIDYQSWKMSKLGAYTRILEPEEELWHLTDGSSYRVVTQPYLTDGLLILFEDITDKLSLERRYNTLIAVQQETLDNLQEAVAVFSEDARLRLANAAFFFFWDLPKRESDTPLTMQDLALNLRNRAISFFDASGDVIDIFESLPIWITNRQERFGRVIVGDDRYLDFSLTILPDGGALWTLNDTTSSERARIALSERNQALESADRMRSEFIANISYELRTPLNSITGFAEMMQLGIGGDLRETQRAYVENILSSADNLKGMISDVLDLAVLQSGKVDLDISPFDPAPVIKSAVTLSEEMLARDSISIQREIGDLPTLVADPLRLKQMMVNLFSAVAIVIPKGSEISHHVGSDGAYLVLLIDIPTVGPSAEYRDKMVEALAAGKMPESRRSTGISLSLARIIVDLHGGDISMDELGDTGIKIVTRLPIKGPGLLPDSAVGNSS